MKRGTIRYKGQFGNKGKSTLLGAGLTQENLTTFRTAIGAYTNAKWMSQSLSDLVAAEDQSTPTDGSNTDVLATIYFRNSADASVHTYTIPGYTGDVERIESGSRIPAATVTAIVELIKTATGITTLTGMYGVYTQKR